MKVILSSRIGNKVKPYSGKISVEDKETITKALTAYSNDSFDEYTYFEHKYGISPVEFIAKHWNKVLKLYGNKKKVTVYRGLHFSTKAKLNRFLDPIVSNSNTLIEKKLTSWTADKRVAELFFSKYILSAIEPVGCLLVQEIGSYEAIELSIDENFRYDENEYLLPPGKFKVEVLDYSVTEDIKPDKNRYKEYKSYMNTLKKRYNL